MIRKIAVAAGAAFAAAAAVLPTAAQALDSWSLELGYGEDSTRIIRGGLQWRWTHHPEVSDRKAWRLAGYWEVSGGVFDNPDNTGADVGVTPVLRVERGVGEDSTLWLEAAVGLHLVTRRISADRIFSTSLQFGDHIGAGLRFGPHGRYDLGVRLQHLSNGSIRAPNPGINFLNACFQYRFE